MDWVKLRSYSRKRPPQNNIHWGSPLPGVATSTAGNRRNAPVKGTHLGLDQRPKPKLESHTKRYHRNAIAKALPNIHENSEVTQMNCHSSDQRSMDVNKDISEMDKTVAKDSSHLNTASKKSSRGSETTSGTTLPTGVSDFLLDCLDVDSLECSSTGSSDRTSSYSSPEIFRDEKESSAIPEGPCLQCKNSTLLETSKAVSIDKMPHLLNLSKILGSQDQSIIRSRSSEQKLRSGLRTGSAVVAGKQLHKIVSTKELRPESQSSGSLLLLPQKHKTQINDDRQSKKMKCRGKETSKSPLESPPSSSFPCLQKSNTKTDITCRNINEKLASKQADVSMEINSVSVNLGRNKAILASTAFQQPEDAELDLSSVRKGSLSEDFLPNTNSVYVNSEEIVPATLSPEKTIFQCLRNPPEICSIIKASPGFRPFKILQHPLNRKELFFPPGSSEGRGLCTIAGCDQGRRKSREYQSLEHTYKFYLEKFYIKSL